MHHVVCNLIVFVTEDKQNSNTHHINCLCLHGELAWEKLESMTQTCISMLAPCGSCRTCLGEAKKYESNMACKLSHVPDSLS